MATVLENLQLAYQRNSEALAALYLNPRPNTSVDGASYQWDSLRSNLLKEQEELLAAIQRAEGPFEVQAFPFGS